MHKGDIKFTQGCLHFYWWLISQIFLLIMCNKVLQFYHLLTWFAFSAPANRSSGAEPHLWTFVLILSVLSTNFVQHWGQGFVMATPSLNFAVLQPVSFINYLQLQLIWRFDTDICIRYSESAWSYSSFWGITPHIWSSVPPRVCLTKFSFTHSSSWKGPKMSHKTELKLGK